MKFAYFSPIMWDDLKQRPQHIAEELSKDHEVIFIEPSVSFIKGYRSKFYKKREFWVNPKLKIVRLSGILNVPKSLNFLNLKWVSDFKNKRLKRYLDESQIIWMGSPIFRPYLKYKKNQTVIYDKMDDYSALTENLLLKKQLISDEKILLDEANLIFTSSDTFFENLSRRYKDIYLIKNALSSDFFRGKENDAPEFLTQLMRDEKKKIFGYIGSIDHWFDFQVIHEILEKSEDNVVVLIGRFNVKVENKKNLFCFESVPKELIPDVISAFDYCLFPFKCDFLDTIDPVKIYEYLAMNKIIIAKKSAETLKNNHLINLYDSKEELDQILGNICKIQKPFNSEQAVSDYKMDNNWGKRVDEILHKITEWENKEIG